MAPTSLTSLENASPTPDIPPNVIGATTSPITLTTEPVEPTSSTIIEIISTTTATPIEPSSSTTITTKPPTISTTTTTKQILSSFITTMKISTSIPDHTSLLSTEISLVPVLTAKSGHSSSVAPTTTSLNSDSPSITSDAPSITSDTPLSTSATYSTTSNITGVTISRILPAVLVPIACLIAILLAVLFIRRSHRQTRQKRATQTPLPFISQLHPPGLSSALSTNRDGGINVDAGKSPRQCSDIGFRGFGRDGGLGNEGELRTREEASVNFLGGNNTLPGLREQIFVLQAQLADIENQHTSRAPPGYSSIHRE